MTKDDIVKNIMGMKADVKDTFTMLKAAEKIPATMLPHVVSISPQGVYTAGNASTPGWVQHIEYGTEPSAGVVTTTTTGTTTTISDTGTDTTGLQTTIGTTANPGVIKFSQVSDPVTWNNLPFAWDTAPASARFKRKRKKKALPPPIKISPRTPGLRRIVLED